MCTSYFSRFLRTNTHTRRSYCFSLPLCEKEHFKITKKKNAFHRIIFQRNFFIRVFITKKKRNKENKNSFSDSLIPNIYNIIFFTFKVMIYIICILCINVSKNNCSFEEKLEKTMQNKTTTKKIKHPR